MSYENDKKLANLQTWRYLIESVLEEDQITTI